MGHSMVTSAVTAMHISPPISIRFLVYNIKVTSEGLKKNKRKRCSVEGCEGVGKSIKRPILILSKNNIDIKFSRFCFARVKDHIRKTALFRRSNFFKAKRQESFTAVVINVLLNLYSKAIYLLFKMSSNLRIPFSSSK